MTTYDAIVVAGRFSPLHNGHKYGLFAEALDLTNHLYVVVGSAYQPRNLSNPWIVPERIEMIEAVANELRAERKQDFTLSIVAVADCPYDDSDWATELRAKVKNAMANHGQDPRKSRVALLGYEKDASSYYLRRFPEWSLEQASPYPDADAVVNATQFRELLLKGHTGIALQALPQGTVDVIKRVMKSDEWQNLRTWFVQNEEYKRQWSHTPFPSQFMTTDAVVVHAGHVLLVRRGRDPGKGLWALPGGFVESSEWTLDACLRELSEETGIKLKSSQLKTLIKDSFLFDAPNRSARGRTYSQAYFFRLSDDMPQPKVRRQPEGDEVSEVRWIPLDELRRMRPYLFEDHFDIVGHFTKRHR